ncbi:MAG: hypothetical protein IKU81_05880 [Oscillibacter sp.]|nr:hypothetical protein [Oscillibacter sp.]
MIGLLIWEEVQKGVRQKPVAIREEILLHNRFLRAEVLRGSRTPERILHRRVLAAEKRLRKAGVTEIILPNHFTMTEHLDGIQPVSTLPLRQALAADWLRRELKERGLRPADTRTAVAADRLTGEVVRTVTDLALRHRHVLLDVPYGGEELCRSLRREYGVSLLLTENVQRQGADAWVLFSPREQAGEKALVLPLYDEAFPMPLPVLPPALEEKLPLGADRLQLLTVLVRNGAIRAGTDLTF